MELENELNVLKLIDERVKAFRNKADEKGRGNESVYLIVSKEFDTEIREALLTDKDADAHINKLFGCIYVVSPLPFQGQAFISHFNYVNVIGEKNIRLEKGEELYKIEEIFEYEKI